MRNRVWTSLHPPHGQVHSRSMPRLHLRTSPLQLPQCPWRACDTVPPKPCSQEMSFSHPRQPHAFGEDCGKDGHILLSLMCRTASEQVWKLQFGCPHCSIAPVLHRASRACVMPGRGCLDVTQQPGCKRRADGKQPHCTQLVATTKACSGARPRTPARGGKTVPAPCALSEMKSRLHVFRKWSRRTSEFRRQWKRKMKNPWGGRGEHRIRPSHLVTALPEASSQGHVRAGSGTGVAPCWGAC